MYQGIARYYELLTSDIDYKSICRSVDKCVRSSRAYRDYKKRGETPILLDAGCGTGELTRMLSERGYDCIGLDISEEMINSAQEKSQDDGILWICQDMCKMNLFGTVTAITSTTDSVNHITSEKKLQKFFDLAHNYLDNGGVLYFDVLDESHFTKNGCETVYFEDDNDVTVIWTSKYNPGNRKCTYDITCFSLGEDGQYTRSDDQVCERVWSISEITSMLGSAGFENIRTESRGSERTAFICERPFRVV